MILLAMLGTNHLHQHHGPRWSKELLSQHPALVVLMGNKQSFQHYTITITQCYTFVQMSQLIITLPLGTTPEPSHTAVGKKLSYHCAYTRN